MAVPLAASTKNRCEASLEAAEAATMARCSNAVLLAATLSALLAFTAPATAQPAPSAGQHGASARDTACPPLLDRQFPRLQDESAQDLCRFTGKVLLVVNTASYCGYTKQYEGLEKLHARYAARGLVVMGFPSNDFRQEAGSSREIAEVCFDTYGVKFPMFTRSGVTGESANPLFADLARISGKAPAWNFNKYLVARDGRTVKHFPSTVEPLDRGLVASIESMLAER